MIVKKAKFGETDNVTVIELGTGDVHMLGSELGENGETVLALKTTKEKGEIGVKVNTNAKSFDDMNPEVAFIFNNPDSIDALIMMLKGCKSEMIKKAMRNKKQEIINIICRTYLTPNEQADLVLGLFSVKVSCSNCKNRIEYRKNIVANEEDEYYDYT
jgi:hypothetical protein